MTMLSINAGPYEFRARMEEELAPQTCAAFAMLLPFEQKVIHVRWSGESTWIPLGDLELGVGYENHTSHPASGQLLLYPANNRNDRRLSPSPEAGHDMVRAVALADLGQPVEHVQVLAVRPGGHVREPQHVGSR